MLVSTSKDHQMSQTTNPYQFIKELREQIKEELRQKQEHKDTKEDTLLILAEREPKFSLQLIRKLEGDKKTTRKVVEFRKYLELLTKQGRQPQTETTEKIKRLFLFLMNRSDNQPRTGTTEREKRFHRYDAKIRRNEIKFRKELKPRPSDRSISQVGND
jgi:hypothetical protein